MSTHYERFKRNIERVDNLIELFDVAKRTA